MYMEIACRPPVTAPGPCGTLSQSSQQHRTTGALASRPVRELPSPVSAPFPARQALQSARTVIPLAAAVAGLSELPELGSSRAALGSGYWSEAPSLCLPAELRLGAPPADGALGPLSRGAAALEGGFARERGGCPQPVRGSKHILFSAPYLGSETSSWGSDWSRLLFPRGAPGPGQESSNRNLFNARGTCVGLVTAGWGAQRAGGLVG